jgi:hypothetical protein
MSKLQVDVHWDFKVIADSQMEVYPVLEALTKLLYLDIRSFDIHEYQKFESTLFSLNVDSILDGQISKILDLRSIVSRLGQPIFIDERVIDKTEMFEAIFDSRKHPPAIPEVFWASIYAEKSAMT